MNLLVLPCVLLLAAWTAAQGRDASGNFYDSRYDYLDIDAILSSKRLVRNYVDCLLNQKPCSPEGKALKRILPEGLRTKCARCTPRQKHNALGILRGLRDHYPVEWAKLSAKWDPTGDFTRRFESFLDKDDNNRVDVPAQMTSTLPPPRPAVLNRFGPEDGGQGAPSEVRPTVRPAPPTVRPVPPIVRPVPPTARPAPLTTARSTMMTTASPSTTTMTPIYTTMRQTRPTNRPVQTTSKTRPKPVTVPVRYPEYDYIPADTRPVMGLIDLFGNKIIKTTELVTGLLKNTVRIVVG